MDARPALGKGEFPPVRHVHPQEVASRRILTTHSMPSRG
jgi:hypothetical protein